MVALTDINCALSLIQPVDAIEGKRKEPHGPRMEQFRTMHGRYVPKWYVPDIFSAGLAQSGILRQRIFERVGAGTRLVSTASSTETSATGQTDSRAVLHYNRNTHDSNLITILSQPRYFSRKQSLGVPDWRSIASAMPCPEDFFSHLLIISQQVSVS